MTEEKETREKKRNGGGATDERGDDGVLGRRARAEKSLSRRKDLTLRLRSFLPSPRPVAQFLDAPREFCPTYKKEGRFER